MESYIVDWLNLGVRWLHLIAGIAWIEASLYFGWLDNHLLPRETRSIGLGVCTARCGRCTVAATHPQMRR